MLRTKLRDKRGLGDAATGLRFSNSIFKYRQGAVKPGKSHLFQATQKLFLSQKSSKFIDRRICGLLILVILVLPRTTHDSAPGTREIKTLSRGYRLRRGS